MPSAFLAERRLIKVCGTGAAEFLQALITCDLASLPQGVARAGALLTPQGKILFDFLIFRDQDGYTLETGLEQRDGLLTRLTLYKLRAPVDLRADTAVEGIGLFWEKPAGDDAPPHGLRRDERFEKAGVTLYRGPVDAAADVPSPERAEAYRGLRIACGIAESGADYALGDVFPHDVLMDENGGLAFNKGCFVGQEVVSRMKHRGTARRRLAIVTGAAALPATGTPVMAEGKPLGALGTVSGARALAIIRTDRAAAAMAAGAAMTAGEIAVTAALPAWSGLTFPAADEPAGGNGED